MLQKSQFSAKKLMFIGAIALSLPLSALLPIGKASTANIESSSIPEGFSPKITKAIGQNTPSNKHPSHGGITLLNNINTYHNNPIKASSALGPNNFTLQIDLHPFAPKLPPSASSGVKEVYGLIDEIVRIKEQISPDPGNRKKQAALTGEPRKKLENELKTITKVLLDLRILDFEELLRLSSENVEKIKAIAAKNIAFFDLREYLKKNGNSKETIDKAIKLLGDSTKEIIIDLGYGRGADSKAIAKDKQKNVIGIDKKVSLGIITRFQFHKIGLVDIFEEMIEKGWFELVKAAENDLLSTYRYTQNLDSKEVQKEVRAFLGGNSFKILPILKRIHQEPKIKAKNLVFIKCDYLKLIEYLPTESIDAFLIFLPDEKPQDGFIDLIKRGIIESKLKAGGKVYFRPFYADRATEQIEILKKHGYEFIPVRNKKIIEKINPGLLKAHYILEKSKTNHDSSKFLPSPSKKIKRTSSAILSTKVSEILENSGAMTPIEISEAILEDRELCYSLDISRENVLKKLEEAINALISKGKLIELLGKSPSTEELKQLKQRMEKLDKGIQPVIEQELSSLKAHEIIDEWSWLIFRLDRLKKKKQAILGISTTGIDMANEEKTIVFLADWLNSIDYIIRFLDATANWTETYKKFIGWAHLCLEKEEIKIRLRELYSIGYVLNESSLSLEKPNASLTIENQENVQEIFNFSRKYKYTEPDEDHPERPFDADLSAIEGWLEENFPYLDSYQLKWILFEASGNALGHGASIEDNTSNIDTVVLIVNDEIIVRIYSDEIAQKKPLSELIANKKFDRFSKEIKISDNERDIEGGTEGQGVPMLRDDLDYVYIRTDKATENLEASFGFYKVVKDDKPKILFELRVPILASSSLQQPSASSGVKNKFVVQKIETDTTPQKLIDDINIWVERHRLENHTFLKLKVKPRFVITLIEQKDRYDCKKLADKIVKDFPGDAFAKAALAILIAGKLENAWDASVAWFDVDYLSTLDKKEKFLNARPKEIVISFSFEIESKSLMVEFNDNGLGKDGPPTDWKKKKPFLYWGGKGQYSDFVNAFKDTDFLLLQSDLSNILSGIKTTKVKVSIPLQELVGGKSKSGSPLANQNSKISSSTGGINLQDTEVSANSSSSTIGLNLSPEVIQQWDEAEEVTFDIITLEKSVDKESLLGIKNRED